MNEATPKEIQTSVGPQQKHSGHKHIFMMMACCLVPLGLAWALSQMGYGTAAAYLAMLMCPLMHLFMMRGRSEKSDAEAGKG